MNRAISRSSMNRYGSPCGTPRNSSEWLFERAPRRSPYTGDRRRVRDSHASIIDLTNSVKRPEHLSCKLVQPLSVNDVLSCGARNLCVNDVLSLVAAISLILVQQAVKKMKILNGISDEGMWYATRSKGIFDYLVKTQDLRIVSSSRVYKLLHNYFGNCLHKIKEFRFVYDKSTMSKSKILTSKFKEKLLRLL
jgi:glycosyl transferase family 1